MNEKKPTETNSSPYSVTLFVPVLVVEQKYGGSDNHFIFDRISPFLLFLPFLPPHPVTFLILLSFYLHL